MFKHIASVPYSAYSVFIDTTNGVNPNITSYQYELSVIDTCGNESALSPFHRTVHVAISPASPCGYNLIWNDYAGFTITQYLIYRDSANTGWKVRDSVSFGNISWTDPTCYSKNDTIGYLVEAVNPSPCTPSIISHKANNTASTRSNAQHNLVTGVSALASASSAISIYPNPGNGIFELKVKNRESGDFSIYVYNVIGEKVLSQLSIDNSSPGNPFGQHTINLSSQPSGVYFVKVFTDKWVQVVKVVKE